MNYMKRFLTGFITTITLAFVGCLADAPISTVDGGKSRVLTATLSSPSTKTSLGNKDGDTYPVLWSEEDQLVVNGVVSEEMEIASEDKSKATFHFGEDLTYPYHITYPYTSSTTADAPKVEFLAEQNYEEGSFAKGSVPMCGYAESKSGTITLKHLAGILRFPVKARTEGVKLQKVVITSLSGAKLSGVFSVDCKSGTITPSETTGTTITYIFLPISHFRPVAKHRFTSLFRVEALVITQSNLSRAMAKRWSRTGSRQVSKRAS